MSQTNRFGFQVTHEPADEFSPGGWKVELPHQCDGWRIDADNAYEDPSSQADALAALDAFIAEAQRAREVLARGEEQQ